MRLLVICLLMLASAVSHAHANGASYMRIESSGENGKIRAIWDIAASDLQLPLELDSDGDGFVTTEEIQARHPAITRFVSNRIGIRRANADCVLSVGELTIAQRQSEQFVRLQLNGVCQRQGPLEVTTKLFFGSPGYAALLDVQTSEGHYPAMLSMDLPAWTEPAAVSWSGTALRFLREGFHHVLIGYDHVAFLLLLLLPSVLSRTDSGWAAVTSGRVVVFDLLKIVTAFTVAHSVTLGLAATGAVRVPVQPIEVAIAASIVVAGLLNLFPAAARWRLRLAFSFGFVHGFGFANALREIDADGTRLVPVLAGFNLGVEFAQLAIVALTLPVLWFLSRSPQYARRLMPALSVATALIGAAWFAGRI